MKYKVVVMLRNKTIRKSMPLECSSPDKAMKLYKDILESSGIPLRTLNFADWYIIYDQEDVLNGIPEHDL